MKTTRREFLGKSGMLVAAGALGSSVFGKTSWESFAEEEKPASLQELPAKRILGRTGMKVSVLTVGTGSTNQNVIKYAMERGINFIHTSPDYAGGNSIKEVGRAIRGTKVHLGLKVIWDWRSDEELDRSLKILGKDYVDIVFFNIHNDPGTVASPLAKEAFERWKKHGKALFMGLTTHGGMKECMESALKTGWYDCLMPAYQLNHRAQYEKIFEECKEQKVGIIAIKTKITERNTEAVPVFLADEVLTTICRTMNSLSEVKAYIEATRRKLSRHEKEKIIRLAGITSSGRCAMCGACALACANSLSVNDIVRSVDYYVDSMEDYPAGREVYSLIEKRKNSDNCLECGLCEKVCPNNVPIRHYVRRAKNMFSVDLS